MKIDVNEFVVLAEKYGVTEAFILLYFHTASSTISENDGKRWTPVNIELLAKVLKFVSARTLRKRIIDMVSAGIIERKEGKKRSCYMSYEYHIVSEEDIELLKKTIVN